MTHLRAASPPRSDGRAFRPAMDSLPKHPLIGLYVVFASTVKSDSICAKGV